MAKKRWNILSALVKIFVWRPLVTLWTILQLSFHGGKTTMVTATGTATRSYHINTKKAESEASEAQQKIDRQAKALADALQKTAAVSTGVEDIVEISDEARELAKAARIVTEAEAGQEVPEEAVAVEATAPAEAAAAKSEVAKPSNEIYGKEAREATGEYYSSVLEGLRSKYAEDEAMRRFDKFMQSEGYELQPVGTDPMYGGSRLGIPNSPNVGMGWWTANMTSFIEANGMETDWTCDRRLVLNSSISAASVGGKTRYYAESTATFFAYNSQGVRDAVAGWGGRNRDSFGAAVDFDVDSFRDAIRAGDQTNLSGANKDLGARMNSLMEKAGIRLGNDESAVFSPIFGEDGEVAGVDSYFIADLGASPEEHQKLVDNFTMLLQDEIANDPDLLNDFNAMYGSTGMADLSELDGAFTDGSRGVAYSQSRDFIMSGSQPGTMVMRDHLLVNQTGFTYQKKTDAFDPDADNVHITAPMNQPGKDPSVEVDKTTNDLKSAIQDAIANGDVIESDIDQETYEKHEHKWNLFDPDQNTGQLYRDGKPISGDEIDVEPEEAPAEETDETDSEEEEEIEPDYGYDNSRDYQFAAVRDMLVSARSRSASSEADFIKEVIDETKKLHEKRLEEQKKHEDQQRLGIRT